VLPARADEREDEQPHSEADHEEQGRPRLGPDTRRDDNVKDQQEHRHDVEDAVREHRPDKRRPGALPAGQLPRQDGDAGQDAQNIQRYIALLRERTTLPVIEWDERFTTVQAERTLITADVSRAQRKKVIDKVAAAIILQSYLDSLHFQKATPWDET